MMFPARNLHLFQGFSIAMLNNQMVVDQETEMEFWR